MHNLYDGKRFEPAAPVINVIVCHPNRRIEGQNADMLIDTGADMTCMPSSVLRRIENLRQGCVSVEGYDREREIKTTYFIILRVESVELFLEVLEVAGEVGLLGRDVLGIYKTCLDGPEKAFVMEAKK